MSKDPDLETSAGGGERVEHGLEGQGAPDRARGRRHAGIGELGALAQSRGGRRSGRLGGRALSRAVHQAAQCHGRSARSGICSCRDVFTRTPGQWVQEEKNSSCRETL